MEQNKDALNFTMDPNRPYIPPKDGSTSGPTTEAIGKIQSLIAKGGATPEELQGVLSSLGVLSDNTVVEDLPPSGEKATVSKPSKKK
jgi:hypothetical protein